MDCRPWWLRRCGTGGHKGRPYERIDGGAALIAGLLIPAVRFGGVWAPRPTDQAENTA